MASQVDQLLRPDFAAKRLFHHFGVGMPYVETDEGANIAKNSLLDGGQKLVNELVRKDQTEPVFARFGED
jgi:hypothetical protein